MNNFLTDFITYLILGLFVVASVFYFFKRDSVKRAIVNNKIIFSLLTYFVAMALGALLHRDFYSQTNQRFFSLGLSIFYLFAISLWIKTNNKQQ